MGRQGIGTQARITTIPDVLRSAPGLLPQAGVGAGAARLFWVLYGQCIGPVRIGYDTLGHHRTGGGRVARRRLDLREAAEALGITVDAARKRVKRGTLESERGADGRVYVFLDDDPDTGAPRSDTEALISTLQDQLKLEREAHAEARRIIAGLVERIPVLEAPGDAESPAPSGPGTAEPSEAERGTEAVYTEQPFDRPRPWWRRFARVFGR